MAMGWLEALFAYLQMEQAKKTDQYNREQNDKPPEVLRSDESKWLWDLLSGLYEKNAGVGDFVQRAGMNAMNRPVQEGVKTGSQYGSDVDITGQTSRYSAGMSAQNDELRKIIASRLGAMGDPPGPAAPAPTTRPGGGGGGGGHGRFQRDFQTGGGGDGMGGGGWSEDYHNNPYNVTGPQFSFDSEGNQIDNWGLQGGGTPGQPKYVPGEGPAETTPDGEIDYNQMWVQQGSGAWQEVATSPFQNNADWDMMYTMGGMSEDDLTRLVSGNPRAKDILGNIYDWVTDEGNKGFLEAIGMGGLALMSGSPVGIAIAGLRALWEWFGKRRKQNKADNAAAASAAGQSMIPSRYKAGSTQGGTIYNPNDPPTGPR